MSARLAIVLAGGRGSRLGGVDKGAIDLDGTTLLDAAVRAVVDGSDGSGASVIVVGPSAPSAAVTAGDRVEVRTVLESPRFGGPAVALRAGVDALLEGIGAEAVDRDAWVTVLACDLVRPAVALAVLDGHGAGVDDDGVVLVDADGRAQWLTARYRLPALAEAVGDAEEGDALRAVVGSLDLALVPAGDAVRDVDTPEDAAREGALVPVPVASGRMRGTTSGTTEEVTVSTPPELDDWVQRLAPQLGLDPGEVPTPLLLDLARDVAHGVLRPGAPVSAYMLGLAVGHGRIADADAGARLIEELAKQWPDHDDAHRSSLEDEPEEPSGE